MAKKTKTKKSPGKKAPTKKAAVRPKSKLEKLENGAVELTITIPARQIRQTYDQVLAQLVKTTEIKGFRKGKAPAKKVEEQVGKNKIYEEVLRFLLPQTYADAVKEHGLAPAMNPQIKVVSLQEDKDWEIKATTAELPEIKLGDYKKAIRDELAASKIWVPGKDDQKPEESKKITQDEKIGKIFKALVKVAEADIPGILLEEEVNRMLSRLISQTEKLGLTVEQYLQSIGKTSEELRAEYRQQAEESLKLELILARLAEKEGVEVTDQEVNRMIAATPDEKARKNLETPAQKAYIRQILRKRKLIDNLLKIA